MASVALIFPSYSYHLKSPPLGLAYLGSFLRDKGHSVSIIDMDAQGMTFSDLRNALESRKPDMVGISAMTPQIENAFRIAEEVKQVDKSIPVVVGGVHSSVFPEQVLNNKSVDFVVIGEGEITFYELVEKVSSNDSLSFKDVKGIAYRNNNQVVITPQRSLIGDLDSLPFPLWDELQFHKSSSALSTDSENSKTYPILGTRGCPYHCIFCASNTVFKRAYRSRSAENIYEEILYLRKKFKAKQFDFVDDTFTIKKEVLVSLCDLILENQLDIKFSLNARVNTVDEELLRKIKEAGCKNIDFGVESGDPHVLRNLKKGINLDQIKKAHRLAKKVGLHVTSFFMVGNPGEDWGSIKKTVDFVRTLETDYPTCSIATPFPGTELLELGNRNGWIKVRDWSKYITTPYFKNDYKPVMSNGLLSQEEILKAYYYLNAEFAKIKLRTKYGKYYYFNIRFYRNELFTRIHSMGRVGLLKLVYNFLKARIFRY
jgi:radical SAM superfamily enzyme YgiQ (UPF0313 family)